jgi:hypothetical protein
VTWGNWEIVNPRRVFGLNVGSAVKVKGKPFPHLGPISTGNGFEKRQNKPVFQGALVGVMGVRRVNERRATVARI